MYKIGKLVAVILDYVTTKL